MAEDSDLEKTEPASSKRLEKAVMPDLGRMNPLKGMTILCKNAAAELVKALLKATLISVVAYIVMSSQKNDMFALSHQPLKSGIEQLGHLLLTGF